MRLGSLIPHISDRHKDSNNKQISMNKKQTYAAPMVEGVILLTREAVLTVSHLTLMATMEPGESAPAVENADFSSNVAW